ncbi:putative baseplate assembly protein [Herbidospora galbida]|uniref:Putative baseplate assembly protein n=1 Tax=Herbidospora galbida TaxID=2575442 RepID=A0A4U3MN09_9ACTN|nr:putative baseplate assembly protein [Herbidospora galbida]TKK89557.1 putative baseplate assembly protein [Herbidospora galbida]
MSAERGRPLPPNLDDRRWSDLVAEATELIGHYAPQWTDRSPGDPGIALVELFAWLVEGLIYRLNQVPEKNYVAFLNLLGVTRLPAVPARTLLTFTAQTGQIATVPRGTQVQTTGSESQAPVVFQTEAELLALPAGLSMIVRYDAPPTPVTATDVTGVTNGFPLRIPDGGTSFLLLGLDPAFTQPADRVELYAEPDQAATGEPATVSWVFSANGPNPANWPALAVERDTTHGLTQGGQVRLKLPAGAQWAAVDPAGWPFPAGTPAPQPGRPRRWVGLKLTNERETGDPVRDALVEIRHLLPNTVAATSATVAGRGAPEVLGTAGRAPRQVFQLRNRPVYRQPGPAPFDHVEIMVDDLIWLLAEERSEFTDQLVRLDPVTGEVIFGEVGATPPTGATISAVYRYVGAGAFGNVLPGTVTTLADGVPGVIAVTNPVPGSGGTDEEPIEETKSRAPQLLRARDRAITAEDYEFLARQVPGVRIARCLAPRTQEKDGPAGRWLKGDPWTFAAISRAPGHVNLIVVPDLGLAEPQPTPSVALVQEVLAALDPRREVTALLQVHLPRYLPVEVTADLRVFRRAVDMQLAAGLEAEKERLRERVARFLHPVRGGPAGLGWQVGQSLYLPDMYQAVQPANEIGYLAGLQLRPVQVPPYHQGGEAWNNDVHRPFRLPDALGPHVRVTDYELICFSGVCEIAGAEE